MKKKARILDLQDLRAHFINPFILQMTNQPRPRERMMCSRQSELKSEGCTSIWCIPLHHIWGAFPVTKAINIEFSCSFKSSK